jgi:hypothetical protein
MIISNSNYSRKLNLFGWKSIIYYLTICIQFPKTALAYKSLANNISSFFMQPFILTACATALISILIQFYQFNVLDTHIYPIQQIIFILHHLLSLMVAIIFITSISHKIFIDSYYFKQSGRFYILTMRIKNPEIIAIWSQIWSGLLLLPFFTLFAYVLSMLLLSFEMHTLHFNTIHLYQHINFILENKSFFFIMLGKSLVFAFVSIYISTHFSLVVKTDKHIMKASSSFLLYSVCIIFILDALISYSIYI